MREKNKFDVKNVLFVLTITLFAVLFFLSICTTVRGQEETSEDMSSYYRELEERFMSVLREELEKDGFSESGVTLSSVISASGIRTYHVYIHHDRFDTMDDAERQCFLEDISMLSFADKNCDVIYEILP